MTPHTPAVPGNEFEPDNTDLDKADRNDKYRYAVWILAALLIGAVTWILLVQNGNAKDQAASEASQKFTLAQQVAAACALKEQADDLGGLCKKVDKIVQEGPAGSTGAQGDPGAIGAQGPLGPKGEQGSQGNQGVQGLLGAQGIFGKTGTQGSTGVPGIAGSNGTAGADGATGSTGADGQTGPAGATGADGKDGATGAKGDTGAAGADGATGPTGSDTFPFKFTFKTLTETFNCTIISSDAVATCTSTTP